MALATPPGLGALHIIRMSGPDSFSIINSISSSPVEKTEDRLQVTFIKSRTAAYIDQVVLMKFYAPNSYTGEDCIEISCHGNGLISKLIIEELVKNGAKYASRGEFTKRAFLNNKIDLNQAINIGNLFNASTETDVYSSVQEIRGTTSRVIDDYLNRIMHLLGECELNIDYPSEINDDSDSFLEVCRGKIQKIIFDLDAFYSRSRRQKLSGYRVVLVGNPNAGKSSLMNYLIGKDRVIVSDRAGTTTDSIEIDHCFDEYILTLVDTAGLEGITDMNEHEYARRSKQELDNADLLIHLTSIEDINNRECQDFWEGQIGNKECIRIFTKNDLISKDKPHNSISILSRDVDYLHSELKKKLSSHYSVVGAKSSNNIHHLSNALSELKKSLNLSLSVDLIVEHLRSAHDHLSMIVRRTMGNADKINSMFDNFCVGK